MFNGVIVFLVESLTFLLDRPMMWINIELVTDNRMWDTGHVRVRPIEYIKFFL